jgi:hypothetical protein
LSIHQIPPTRTAEDIFPKGKLILEIILLHNPRRSQTAAIKTILDVILFEHHFLEYFGKRITSLIRGMCLRFSDRDRMRINEMANTGITTNQNKLLECWARSASFKQPE